MTLRLISACVCASLFAACGQVPQPFSQAPRVIADSPFLDTPTAVGIAIMPVVGVPSPLDVQLSEAMAEKFETHDIPAEPVTVNRGLGFTLQGEIEHADTTGPQVAVRIVWRLKSRRGAIAADYRQTATIPIAAWQNGDRGAAGVVAVEAAGKLTQIIAGDAPAQVQPAPPPPRPTFPNVSIRPVDGAPGDGRQALQLAVTQMLLENGVRRDDVTPDVVLNCTVTATPINATLQRVEIVWRAQRRDGTDLGNVKLENTIPAGSLDGPWGPTAFAIANAAGSDLLQLLVTIGSGQGKTPANPAGNTGVANPQQPRR